MQTWIALFGVFFTTVVSAQELRLETVLSGLDSPVQVTNAGDERLFVVTLDGQVLIVKDDALLPTPFLDIENRVLSGGERGLLSVAFHPNFAANGRFFVNYTRRPDGATVISRFTVGANADRANAGSETVLMTIGQPFANHNGGQIHFGADDLLYIATGDGGSGNDPQCHAQRRDSLLGKVLRIDPDGSSSQSPNYGIPLSNPFVGAGTFREEIWGVGLRNPYRFSFDRATGDLFIGDVGQGQIEEVDFAGFGQGGLNFGWKACEGSQCSGNVSGCPDYVSASSLNLATKPILEYNHSRGDCSITGGYRYRGNDLPDHRGHYFYGDFCTGDLRSARRTANGWVENDLDLIAQSVSSFGEDRDGELYLTTLNGSLLKLVVEGVSSPGSGGTFSFVPGRVDVSENSVGDDGELPGTFTVEVTRTGSFDGEVAIPIELRNQTATEGLDFSYQPQTVRWEDGDSLPKQVSFTILDDSLAEVDEQFVLVFGPIEGEGVSADDRLQVLIQDDERRASCEGENVLCLLGGRFAARSEWRTKQGTEGFGNPVELTADAGHFWFFEAENVEVVVKMVDACEPFDAYWVFAAGLTNVEVRLTVVDTVTDELVVYQNPQETPFEPIDDTTAFRSCP